MLRLHPQYICCVNPLLRNPVYNSLLYNDAHLGFSFGDVKWFHPDVSPFAGFAEDNEHGFRELYDALPAGRKILYATPLALTSTGDWQLIVAIEGLQFVFEGEAVEYEPSFTPTLLGPEHVEQMMALAALTKPGPFGKRTIEFGHYYGVFENDNLVAMTGQRLHIQNFTEVSAVCTHPGCLGKGYATALVQYQVNLILRHNHIPFLHVRADNGRAIAVYERLGFQKQEAMNFYFLKK